MLVILYVSSGTQLLAHPFHVQNNDLFLESIDISTFILFVFIKAMWHFVKSKVYERFLFFIVHGPYFTTHVAFDLPFNCSVRRQELQWLLFVNF